MHLLETVKKTKNENSPSFEIQVRILMNQHRFITFEDSSDLATKKEKKINEKSIKY